MIWLQILLVVVGVALVTVGLWMIFVPAALGFLGVAAIVVGAVVLDDGDEGDDGSPQ